MRARLVSIVMQNILVSFKEKVFDFDKLFNWTYLSIQPSSSIRYMWVYVFTLGAFIIAGLILLIYTSRTIKPKFYKRYLGWVSSFLIYVPLLLIFHLLLRTSGIELLSNRLSALVLLSIWLIWLVFLLYYLIVRLPKYFRLYVDQKRREKYIKDGSKR